MTSAGRDGGDRIERLPRGRGFGADRKVGLAADKGREPAPKQGIGVDDEDAPLLRRSPSRVIGHGFGLSFPAEVLRAKAPAAHRGRRLFFVSGKARWSSTRCFSKPCRGHAAEATVRRLRLDSARTPIRSVDLTSFDKADGASDQLGRPVDVQLLLEVFAIGFDRLRAQIEDRRDLPRAPPLPDQPEHLQLAVAERRERRLRFRIRRRRNATPDPSRALRSYRSGRRARGGWRRAPPRRAVAWRDSRARRPATRARRRCASGCIESTSAGTPEAPDFQRLHQVEAVLAALERQIDDREIGSASGDGLKRGYGDCRPRRRRRGRVRCRSGRSARAASADGRRR